MAKGQLQPSKNVQVKTETVKSRKVLNIDTKENTDVEQEKNILQDVDNVLQEAAACSCQEKRWKRPSQISWGARDPNNVTWGKGVNSWFETYPGKGKETR